MTDEEQRRFLIQMLSVMVRELIVYKGFVEHLKGSGTQAEAVDAFLSQMRSDPSIKTQLGPDFQRFVESAFHAEESDAGLILRAFLEGWTSQSDSN